MLTIKGKGISVNRLYIGKRYLSKEGSAFKEMLGWEAKKFWHKAPLAGDVGIAIDFYYSDKRRRDIDNPIKAILDSLNGIIYKDDSQIVDLTVTKNKGENRIEIKIYDQGN